MAHNERLIPRPGEVLTWGGFKWKPAPDEGYWFKWEAGNGGIFQLVHEDNIPDEFWVWLAKRALLNDLTN